MMGIITEEQRKVVKQIAEITGKPEQQIMNLSYVETIDLLVKFIESARKPLIMSKMSDEEIEEFKKEWKRAWK